MDADVVLRNWEDLPPELLHLIVNKLPDICDFIRFRAVCKTWRTSISVSDMRPQFPWLLKKNKSTQRTLQFYSIALEKFYNIALPESASDKYYQSASMFAHRYRCGDQFSHLCCEKSLQFGKKYFSLLNPLNNTEVHLPFSDNAQFSGVWINLARSSQGEDLQLVSNGTRQLALCKPSNGNWESMGEILVYNYIYLKGFVFTVSRTTKFTSVTNISTGEAVYVVPPPDCEISEGLLKGPFLVGASGCVLSVCYNYSDKMERYQFYIHRLDLGNGNKHPCWVRVTSIDKQILFFDFIECRSFSMSVDDFGGKGNCIYFIKWKNNSPFLRGYNLYKYDIENGKSECIDCPFYLRGFTWYQPSLHHV